MDTSVPKKAPRSDFPSSFMSGRVVRWTAARRVQDYPLQELAARGRTFLYLSSKLGPRQTATFPAMYVRLAPPWSIYSASCIRTYPLTMLRPLMPSRLRLDPSSVIDGCQARYTYGDRILNGAEEMGRVPAAERLGELPIGRGWSSPVAA
jgi:hypothetical protein